MSIGFGDLGPSVDDGNIDSGPTSYSVYLRDVGVGTTSES